MKFVIIGSALHGNKGAAAMLESTVQTLTGRYPDAKFTLLSPYPEADKRLNDYRNLTIIPAKPLRLGLIINPLALTHLLLPPLRPLLKKNQAIAAIADADVMLEEGGITFSDGRELYLIYNVASVLPAVFLRTPVVKVAQAVGPFNKGLNKFISKLILPRMRLIVARGEYTFDNLKQLGLKNVVNGADYAFSLEIEPKHIKKAKKFLTHSIYKDKRKIVGIAPSAVIQKRFDKLGKDYIGMNTEFIKYLISKDYNIALLPHSMRAGSDKIHNNDLPLCRHVYKSLGDTSRVMFIDDEIDSQSTRYLIGKCDLFIASRFHSMVAALSTGVPMLVVGWSHKYAEVLKMFDVENQAFDYKKMDPSTLINNFIKLENNQQQIKMKINKHLPQVKKLSMKHIEYIDQTVRKTTD